MRKIGVMLLIVSLFMIGINTVVADVPSVSYLEVTVETNGRTLTITVRHNGPSSIHYVSELEIQVGEESIIIELDPQSASAFTEVVEIAVTGNVQVRADCTLHGWSSWASLGGDTDPIADSRGGIPGFSLLALSVGLGGFLLNHRNR